MIEGYLQVAGLPGNSTDPAHLGWLELVKVEVKADPSRRRVPGAGATAVPPILVYGWSVLGPHSRSLRAAWALGQDLAWAVLEVVRPENGKPALKHRIRMTAVHFSSYQPDTDPGLAKPILQFVLVPTTYTSVVGSALRLTLQHEQPHAGSGASTAAGGPPRRPVPNDRSPPGGHG